MEDPNAHAMMIYPMKALAFDQREQIQRLCEPLGISAASYDGDTSKAHKKMLRDAPPRILLTNPEYLNMAFLGWREQWKTVLSNLRYVVIDEMHQYRGFFGGNMALLLRRFFLYLKRTGTTPRVFLSTATCANPAEHSGNLTGRSKIHVISAGDVLRSQRHFLFVKPDLSDDQYQDALRERVEQAALAALSARMQVLVFCPSKHFLENAFRNSQEKAKNYNLDANRLSVYYADLKIRDRRRIQKKVKGGGFSVVFATSALELGIDIGGLDGVILAGFPSNIMSAWQQIGRAGRGWDRDAFVLFYAMNDPIDRFFVKDIDAFLNKPLDHLVIDPNNQELISAHLASLTAETKGNLQATDKCILGKTFFAAASKLSARPAGRRSRPQHRLQLRGGMGQSYQLKCGDEDLGQIPALRRFREAYIGAIITFLGRKYRVHAHEKDAIVLEEYRENLKTEPRFSTTLLEADIFDGFAYGEFEVYYGSLTIQMIFYGYRLANDPGNETVDFIKSNDARWQNNLHAFWVNVSTK